MSFLRVVECPASEGGKHVDRFGGSVRVGVLHALEGLRAAPQVPGDRVDEVADEGAFTGVEQVDAGVDQLGDGAEPVRDGDGVVFFCHDPREFAKDDGLTGGRVDNFQFDGGAVFDGVGVEDRVCELVRYPGVPVGAYDGVVHRNYAVFRYPPGVSEGEVVEADFDAESLGFGDGIAGAHVFVPSSFGL